MNPEYIVELEPDVYIRVVKKPMIMATDQKHKAKRYKTRRAAREDCGLARRLFPRRFSGAWVIFAGKKAA